MIIQFSFKNFKSFKNEVTLDMTATKMTELQSHVTNINNDKILKVAAIYGANAAGKSNIYNAFEYMTYYVISSFKFGGESESKQIDKEQYTKVTPFLFDKNAIKEPTTFEVFFIDNKDLTKKTYQYGFTLLENEVIEEWLYAKAKTSKEFRTIFYRHKDEGINFAGIKKGTENIEISLEKETLIVSLGAKLKIDLLKRIRDWFLENEIINFGDPLENLLRANTVPDNFVESKDVQNKVVEYFASFDDAIKDFNIKNEDNPLSEDEEMKVQIDALHKINETSELIPLSLKKESSGTLKMFALYPSIQEVLKNGSTLLIDELNSRLHPLLVRNIILTFINPELNKNNAQLIFTTHDIWQISNGFLRRDEIWFVEKNTHGISDLYSLADFSEEDGTKIRKDEAYPKNYLLGKYGAIPQLKAIDILEGNLYEGK